MLLIQLKGLCMHPILYLFELDTKVFIDIYFYAIMMIHYEKNAFFFAQFWKIVI